MIFSLDILNITDKNDKMITGIKKHGWIHLKKGCAVIRTSVKQHYLSSKEEITDLKQRDNE